MASCTSDRIGPRDSRRAAALDRLLRDTSVGRLGSGGSGSGGVSHNCVVPVVLGLMYAPWV